MNDEQLTHARHTLAHLLAAAVHDLYPHALPSIGPAIETGFYYDFDFGSGEKPGEQDLQKIEQKMREILKSWDTIESELVSPERARAVFTGNPYKLELIDEIIARNEALTLYHSKHGDTSIFTDLCRGGHTDYPKKEIVGGGFTLDRIAGAYWRGDEKNPMLIRIYGIAFDTKEKLEDYKKQIEEAKKRDHRKLGAELRLFTISPLVGSGLPLLKPNGMILRQEIENYLWDLHKDKGYSKVWTPHITNLSLYEISGHAEKFGEELFRVQGGEEKFALKPMNCPHHMQIFADDQFSYRDMPVRYFEPATVYRYERSGQLSGLTRVRAITQDDGHLFCRTSQITEEVSTIVGIIRTFYETMGLLDNYWVSLSVRGTDGMYLGGDDVWEQAEKALEEAADLNALNYKRVEGEAAFYGPKLDFMFKDAIGREWQLATIQCDFNLPERFDLTYTNEKGEKERPVVIHRAISGSIERFMGVMIEHFAGNFPFWLAPVELRILPVSDVHRAVCTSLVQELRVQDIRAELDTSDDSLGKRIRAVKVDRLPAHVVVGDKEVESGSFTIEWRTGEKESLSRTELVQRLATLRTKRAR